MDLSFYLFNRVIVAYFYSDGLSSQKSDKDLLSSSESEYKVESWFLLDVVVSYCSVVLECLSCEDESLLVVGDSFFVLDLGLDVFDGVCVGDVEGDGFSGECSYKYLLHEFWL